MEPQTLTTIASHQNLPPPPTAAFNSSSGPIPMHHHMMMHMAFYWGKNAIVLFKGWPGTSSGMYALSVVSIFVLAFLLEWLSNSGFMRSGSNGVGSGLVQTVVYAIRSGMSYMVMLAVMSFNAGIFIAAVAGHALGFFVFGSRAFRNDSDKRSDRPEMHC